MGTVLLKEISIILTDAGIDHYIDPDIKRFGGNKPYYTIKRSPRRIFFTDFYKHGFLQAITPKKFTPENIWELYKIQSEIDDANSFTSYAAHYILKIPYAKSDKNIDLINSKYTCLDKKDFFIDIGQGR